MTNACQTPSTLLYIESTPGKHYQEPSLGGRTGTLSLCLNNPLHWVLGVKDAAKDLLTVAGLMPKLGCQGVGHTCQTMACCHYRAHIAKEKENIRPQRSCTLHLSV